MRAVSWSLPQTELTKQRVARPAHAACRTDVPVPDLQSGRLTRTPSFPPSRRLRSCTSTAVSVAEGAAPRGRQSRLRRSQTCGHRRIWAPGRSPTPGTGLKRMEYLMMRQVPSVRSHRLRPVPSLMDGLLEACRHLQTAIAEVFPPRSQGPARGRSCAETPAPSGRTRCGACRP